MTNQMLRADIPQDFEVLYQSAHLQDSSGMDWRHYLLTGEAKLFMSENLEDETQTLYFCQKFAEGYRFYKWTDRGWIFKK